MPGGDTLPTLIPSQDAGGPRRERLTDLSVVEQESGGQRFLRLCEVWVIAETLLAVVRGFRKRFFRLCEDSQRFFRLCEVLAS